MGNGLAIATLAVGIGASTAMFSFVRPMLLQPLLYPRAERLMILEDRDAAGHASGVSWPEFRDISRSGAFSDAAAFDIGFFFLTGVDQPEQIPGALVTSNLFRMLGAAPVLGRDFREGEDGVVILSDACWRRRFGADPNILGRSIALDFARTPETERYTVLGVMPPDFRMYYSDFEVFVPLPRTSKSEERNARGLTALGRLRDGVTLQQAFGVIGAMPHEREWTTGVRSWEKSQTESIRPGFTVLCGGAALLLLIAAANVAGLLMVRAEARRREIAIRAAMGATPGRIVRMLLGEAIKLGAFAGALGLLLAWWGVRILVGSLPKGNVFGFLPSLDRVTIDLPALMFAIVAATFACVLAGMFPAIAARRTDLMIAMKQDHGSIHSSTARTMLVAAEIALSVTLLAGAGLLIRTMARIGEIDPGFRPDHLLALRAPVARGTDRVHAEAYYRELRIRLAALPGVESAAFANAQPLTGAHREEFFEVPGREEKAKAEYRVVTPDYFTALGIPILRGHAFDARDERRVVVSASLARRYWPGQEATGQSIRLNGESLEIVGVCGDTRDALLRDPTAILYRSWRDEPDRAQQVDLRTSGDPLALAHAVNGVVRDLGGVVAEVEPGRQFLDEATWQHRQSAQVLGVFAGLALALAAVGLYGVIALAIGRRTREIGIRIAMGARRSDVAVLVFRESLGPLLAGLAIGLAMALAISRLLGSLLYEVSPSDPMVLTSAAGVATIATVAACFVPLRRALRVDPLVALRSE